MEEEENGGVGVNGVALAFRTVVSAEETDGTGKGGREDTTVVISGGRDTVGAAMVVVVGGTKEAATGCGGG